ncbi:glycerol-3-phosphate 1-O-acyltransferase [Rickettsiales endosymbiont of Peranema trichophorum]|uniref:glycerol-3-phosphate 1-O-acyltransferase PlsY n=1 Tax=Rickettsiales endosymbiont of Peranema trichophorum TaxID=2486577 RepID=UPI001023A158|nr:glycerol-3-phosphate 1-O-acyltransferase PlsY [Rickettsiales endosymbiont of Peranema trichophorum]RZI47202.1 glycerol-3-phosphate 1-O-acyltransferase [Rickettsiales endosymbiont of Peranema trichophorum]
MIYTYLIAILISYICGSVPFGLLLSRIQGLEDIRSVGSRNIGATNAWRVGGKRLGILTFALDVLKGVVAIVLVRVLHGHPMVLAVAGVAAVYGHVFPIWLDWKGGKGVATSFGVLISVVPYLGFLFSIVWLLTFLVTRIASIASLLAITVIVIASLFLLSTPYVLMVFALFVVITLKHTENIRRILSGEEKTFIF